MDSLGINLIDAALPQARSETLKQPDNASKTQQEQFAHDFETILIEKLFEIMKNSIGNWGFEKDAASKQVQGLFWMHLAEDISAKGGMGLWKKIQQSLEVGDSQTKSTRKLNETL